MYSPKEKYVHRRLKHVLLFSCDHPLNLDQLSRLKTNLSILKDQVNPVETDLSGCHGALAMNLFLEGR
jgi:hypothetical protein